jgi:predicted nucleotidyltransferase
LYKISGRVLAHSPQSAESFEIFGSVARESHADQTASGNIDIVATSDIFKIV